MIPLAVAGALVGGAIGGATAAAASTDFTGISLVIAASGSVIGTVGGLYLAIRRKSTVEEAAELLREINAQQHQQGPPHVP